MRYRAILGSATLACAGLFSTAALAAEECGPLKMATSVKLINFGRSELIPVDVNGVPKVLLLDTGGYMSQLSRDTVEELKLATHDSAVQLIDISGNVSRKYVIADTLKIGTLVAPNHPMLVSPGQYLSADGILSSDLLLRYDVEMDFPGKKMNYFLPDHCKGKVVYWRPDGVAAVPITIKDKSRLMVPVKLGDQTFNAMIDTGASRTTITMATAKRVFGLEPGSAGMTAYGNVNGDPKLASYTHVFPSLSFEGIAVTNPKVAITPDRAATSDKSQQTMNRARTNGEFLETPEMLLGMDIMRHLRMYWAFKEGMLYVSAGTPVSDATSRTQALAGLDEVLALSPNNPGLLNDRCFERALTRTNLEGALADCELSLKLRPGDSATIDSKGFVLFQLGRYQDSVNAYNEALKLSPENPSSLFIRGLAKQKLGTGGSADIAAAKAINTDIKSAFDGAGLTEN
jgi:predicted aspartyl protease